MSATWVFPQQGSTRIVCKEFMRRSVESNESYAELRRDVWPLLPRLNKEDSELNSVRSLSKRSELCRNGNKLGALGTAKKCATQRFDIITEGEALDFDEVGEQEKVNAIAGLLNRHFMLSEVGFIVPIVTIALRTLQDCKLTMSLVWDLLEKPSTYFRLSMKSYQIFVHAFKENLASVMPQTTATLNEIGALKRKFLDEFFVHFFHRLLPAEDVERMVDCYLIEGWKVLMRYAVAIFAIHKKDIKDGRHIPGSKNRVHFTSGEGFWEYLRSCKDKHGIYGLDLVRQAYEGNLFKVRHVSRGTLLRLIARCERSLEWSEEEEKEYAEPIQLDIYLPVTSTKDQPMSTTTFPVLTPQELLSLGPVINSLVSEASILCRETATVLARHIPEIAQLEGFRRVYCSSRHGRSIEALYAMCSGLYPSIMLVKGFSPTIPGLTAVVGLYLTESLSPEGFDLTTASSLSSLSVVRGSPQCFCFRLDGVHAGVHFPARPDITTGTIVEGQVGEARNQKFTLTQYFSSNTKNGIVAGGSAAYSTNALKLDVELNSCYSGPSDTYQNNQSLLPEFCLAPAIIGSLDVADVEVLCGNHSVNTAIRTGRLVLSADNKVDLRRADGGGPNVDSYIHNHL